MGPNAPNYDGTHHIGFQVDHLEEACAELEGAGAQKLTEREGPNAAMGPPSHWNFQMKWSGPDGVVIDISHTGWQGIG